MPAGLAGHVARQSAVLGKPWCPGDEDLVVAGRYPDRISVVPELAGNPRVERLGGGHLPNPSLKLSAQNRNTGKSAWMRAGSGATPSPSAQWARRDSIHEVVGQRPPVESGVIERGRDAEPAGQGRPGQGQRTKPGPAGASRSRAQAIRACSGGRRTCPLAATRKTLGPSQKVTGFARRAAS